MKSSWHIVIWAGKEPQCSFSYRCCHWEAFAWHIHPKHSLHVSIVYSKTALPFLASLRQLWTQNAMALSDLGVPKDSKKYGIWNRYRMNWTLKGFSCNFWPELQSARLLTLHWMVDDFVSISPMQKEARGLKCTKNQNGKIRLSI